MTAGFSQKGTVSYMAPEVARGMDYDARVDIYSLGIMLYRLLNRNRMPFLESDKQMTSPAERKNAVDRRMRGEVLPPPCEASPDLARLILKACAYHPEGRFASAEEMKNALLRIAEKRKNPVPPAPPAVPGQPPAESSPRSMDETTADKTVPLVLPGCEETKTLSESELFPEESKNGAGRRKQKILAAAAVLLALGAVGIGVILWGIQPDHVELAPTARRTEYYTGDTLETRDIVLNVINNFGQAAQLTEGFTCDPAVLSETGPQTITVTYEGMTTEFEVNVTPVKMTSISVMSKPSDISYFVGETLNTSGLTLIAKYNNGTSETISSGFEYSPRKLTQKGTQTITVTYDGIPVYSYNVNVAAVEVSSISIKSNPNDISYFVGNTLNTNGLKLTVKYNNNTTETISSGFSCSPTKLSAAGTQKITVTYKGKSTSFDVTVAAAKISSISIQSNPYDLSYFVGETLDTSGLKLIVKNVNGATKIISTGFTCTPAKLSTAGIQKITVTYGGKTTTFNVKVTAYPFEQTYWVIFTEGHRDDRVEASTIDSTTSPDNLYIIWDKSLYLNNMSHASECMQYHLDENNEWIYRDNYHVLSGFATNVLASNLDIYDKDGNLILEKCQYHEIDWAVIESYK